MKPDRLVQPPPRSGFFGRSVILLTGIIFSILPFSFRPDPRLVALTALLLVAALLLKEVYAVHITLLTVLISGVRLHPDLEKWPYALLVPVLLYGMVVLSARPLRKSLLEWLRSGRLDHQTLAVVAAVAALSGLALCAWYALLKPDLAVQLGHFPGMPLWLYPIAGLGFACGNAALEEFVFRGVLLQAFDSALGPGNLPVLVQAWLFGAMHYLRGFPRGGWGLIMAAVYGVMLGAIRRTSQGMLAPWLAHVLADLVIFAILAGIILHA